MKAAYKADHKRIGPPFAFPSRGDRFQDSLAREKTQKNVSDAHKIQGTVQSVPAR
jgi:hypothetical protein